MDVMVFLFLYFSPIFENLMEDLIRTVVMPHSMRKVPIKTRIEIVKNLYLCSKSIIELKCIKQ